MATTSIEASNLFNVKGLVAVVTGGGSGIGAMMARALALNGAAKVYIVGRRKDKLEEVAKSTSTSNIIIPIVGDVTSKENLAFIVSTVTQEVGFINVLIANSGILGPQASIPKGTISSVADFQKAYGDVEFEDYVDTFRLNAAGTWFTVMAFLGLLDEGNKKANVSQTSQVIATSSIASFNRAAPGGYAYGQSKAATTHLVKQLATGLVPFGIRSNAIAPGLFPSDMSATVIGGSDGNFPKSMIPLERVGTEEDMAGAILFLTSKAGAYVTGNVIVIDGGRLSNLPSAY
ncbi:hypothetical protein BJ878DRAFT_510289 [Calycina marina]|uniref:Uncharacterized protein n=1 Tax=Calycina marina TaxID=1763456 RepID=A0A9P7Z295_9HELO|nr:hypothetical protein BJ878DRAFT_510289 [Calycina marina]